MDNQVIGHIWICPPLFDGLELDYVAQVFLGLAIITGDAVYNMIKVIAIGLLEHKKIDNAPGLPPAENPFHEKSPVSYDEEVRTQTFLKDLIPNRVAVGGYVAIAVISTAIFPFIFPALKWYYILIIYLISPILGFCKAYSTGLTDMSITSNLGKLAIFIFASWAGQARGSVLVGLAACGIIMNSVDVASDVMESFRIGYMTLSSPKSLLLSKLIGISMGSVISPSIFLYLKSHNPGFGTPDSRFSAAWTSSFREASMQGTSATLPKHCLNLSLAFFFAAILISLLRDSTPKKWRNVIPIPMAFAIPFYIGAYVTIDMCVGYLIFYTWRSKNKARAETFAPFVGSALIFGDGLWLFPVSVLNMRKITPPMCMRCPSRWFLKLKIASTVVLDFSFFPLLVAIICAYQIYPLCILFFSFFFCQIFFNLFVYNLFQWRRLLVINFFFLGFLPDAEFEDQFQYHLDPECNS